MSQVDEDLYRRWLTHVFDRPKADPKRSFERNDAFVAAKSDLVTLMGETFARCGTDLVSYSNHQVSAGLEYMLYNYVSDSVYAICKDGVPLELRKKAVLNIKLLYKDCFSERCDRALSHTNEAKGNPLNGICYMLWDVSPLCQWNGVVLEVMEAALHVPHDACIESALHGLGHRYFQDEARVSKIISRFLRRTPHLRPQLRSYAELAMKGSVL